MDACPQSPAVKPSGHPAAAAKALGGPDQRSHDPRRRADPAVEGSLAEDGFHAPAPAPAGHADRLFSDRMALVFVPPAVRAALVGGLDLEQLGVAALVVDLEGGVVELEALV